MATTHCRMCGKGLDEHFMVIRSGVAHTGSYDEAGSPRYCSALAGEREYLRGELSRLQTVIGSLKVLAGRMRNTGGQWDFWDLQRYASRWERERERLIGYEKRYYAEKEDSCDH